MNRPTISKFVYPKCAKEMPLPIAKAGVILEYNSGWRTERPVLEMKNCVNCLTCYLVCPEGTIYKDGAALKIDYDFCKGCGICANECPKKAITMIAEEA
jgi:pyruvate ferredoxin oxidoreductase delta subunit